MSCSREFTHRVKSVSMAKFTAQEVDALQKGGNQVNASLAFFHVAMFPLILIMLISIPACTRVIFNGMGSTDAEASR